MTQAKFIVDARGAFTAKADVRRRIAAMRSDADAKDRAAQAADDQQRHDQLDELHDAAEQLIAGAPTRRGRSQRGTTQAPELRAAAALLRRRADELERTIPALDITLHLAALKLVAALQAEALADLRRALEGIMEPAARLFAADHLFAAFIGEGRTFTVPAGAPAFIRGQALLAGLFEKLPASIRPENFDHASIFQDARSISGPLLAQIREGE